MACGAIMLSLSLMCRYGPMEDGVNAGGEDGGDGGAMGNGENLPGLGSGARVQEIPHYRFTYSPGKVRETRAADNNKAISEKVKKKLFQGGLDWGLGGGGGGGLLVGGEGPQGATGTSGQGWPLSSFLSPDMVAGPDSRRPASPASSPCRCCSRRRTGWLAGWLNIGCLAIFTLVDDKLFVLLCKSSPWKY